MRQDRWWQVVMLLTWLAGLITTFLCSTFTVVPGIILGALAVGGGIFGYDAAGGARNIFWRVHMLSMLPLGVFMIAHPPVDWRNGVPQTWLPIPLGVVFLIVAVWGLWPDRGQLAAQPPQP